MDLGFIIKCVIDLDYGKLFSVVKKIAKEDHKASIIIFFDVVSCGIKYGAGYMDYYIFRLDQVPKDKRDTFVTRTKNNHYVKTLNKKEAWPLLEDKALFLEQFATYCKRNWLNLEKASKDDFIDFYQCHKRIVVKPKCGTHGHKVEVLETGEDPNTVYDRLIQNGQVIIEEYVGQHDDIKRLYPYSVNTLRIVTIKKDGKLNIVFACMRLGNGKDNVDNLNHGGLAVIIDEKKGELVGVGADRDDKAYQAHPMTGVTFDGFKIPYFKEAIDMIEKASELIPELNYVGWDIAITNDGPLIIEANHFPGHDIYQLPPHTAKDHMGIDPHFKAILK